MTKPENHLLIGGTGRAGTSFLVRYLTAVGLDTHISRKGEDQWDEQAGAGFEDFPVRFVPGRLPYVVKSPWLGECIDVVLNEGRIAIDAVLLPMRDLTEVATSRTAVERHEILRSSPGVAALGMGWDVWSRTPGGMLYSLHPLDQARVLAVGFHHLLQRLVQADIPVVMLDFSRFISDPAYLYRKLRWLLPAGVTEDAALAAHSQVVDAKRVRVASELAAVKGIAPVTLPERDARNAEVIALRREMARLRGLADEATARGRREAEALKSEIERLRATLAQCSPPRPPQGAGASLPC